MGCGSCRTEQFLRVEGFVPPLPSEGAYKMRVKCTSRSLRGKAVKQHWNSNAQLLWHVSKASLTPQDEGRRWRDGDRAANIHGTGSSCEDAESRPPWFYLTTSTDVYHFGVFLDTWARIRAYNSKEVAAEVLVQICEKEKILRFVISVGGVEQMTLVRIGIGIEASIFVEPAAMRAGDFAWEITSTQASRRKKLLVEVDLHTGVDEFAISLHSDDIERAPLAPALLLFAIGFILGCGIIRAVDVFLRTGLAEEDQQYRSPSSTGLGMSGMRAIGAAGRIH